MSRLFPPFTVPAIGAALAIAALALSGTVAAKTVAKTDDRPSIEASKPRDHFCGRDDAAKAEHHTKERDQAKAGRDTVPGPLQLASRLAALESFVGIQAEQFAAWRAYTDALQAFIRAPEPAREADVPPDALTQSSALAYEAAARAQLAVTLASTVDVLRARLTAEQVERLRQAGPLLPSASPGAKADARPRGCA